MMFRDKGKPVKVLTCKTCDFTGVEQFLQQAIMKLLTVPNVLLGDRIMFRTGILASFTKFRLTH